MKEKNLHIALWAVVIMVLLSGHTSAWSQSLEDTLHFDEVSVFSKRPANQTALTVTSLDSAVLSRYVNQSLSELMSEESPLFVKSLGRGALATVSFRGTAPSHTKVTWNGLELNSPMLGMVDFSEIPVFLIDGISILHGNNSLVETPGALGGILDLTSKTDWKSGLSGSLAQGAGSYGTWDEYGRLNYGNSRFQSSTRMFFNHSDNDYRYRNYDTPDSVDILTGKKYYPVRVNSNADYTNKGVMQQFAFRRKNNEMLDVNLWLQQSERSIPMLSTNESETDSPPADNLSGTNNTNRQDNRFFRSATRYRKYGNRGKFTLFSGINYNLLSYRVDRFLSRNGMLRLVDSQSRVFHFDNRASWQYKLSRRDELAADLRYVFDVVKTKETVSDNYYTKSRGEATLGLSWFHSFSEAWRIRASAVAGGLGNEFMTPSFSAGGEYHVLPGDKLYFTASFSSNHRYPTLNDLYFQPGGNPDLRPENSVSREAGMVFRSDGRYANLRAGISAYHSSVKNWIIWLPSYKGYWQPFNIEKVVTDGIEVNFDFKYQTGSFGWRAMGNYALTRSRNFDDPVNWADNSYGKQLPYIPVHSANLNLSSAWKNWSIVYSWNFYSQRYTTSSNERSSYRDYLYPYFMNQVRAGKRIDIRDSYLDLSFTVFNLFNESYRSVLQRQMPGRNYRLIARFSW